MDILFSIAQGAPQGGEGSFFSMILPFVLILAVFYFLILRPQSKKQKERQKMLDAVEKGNDVVTIGGIHGKVMGFKNDNKTLILKVDDNVKLNVDRSAIASIGGEKVQENK